MTAPVIRVQHQGSVDGWRTSMAYADGIWPADAPAHLTQRHRVSLDGKRWVQIKENRHYTYLELRMMLVREG